MCRRGALALALLLSVAACARPPEVRVPAERTVESVVASLGPTARARLAPFFRAAGLEYPPAELALLGFKRERRLEVWARDGERWARINAYPILAASGGPGPKQRQGDRQVPEGVYGVIGLNPNSRFHLSIGLDYPNVFDLEQAALDGVDDPGSEIFIHGGAASIGCLAMGDRVIEELFVLVADVGIGQVRVVLAPWDPRGGVPLAPLAAIPFTAELYPLIEERLQAFE